MYRWPLVYAMALLAAVVLLNAGSAGSAGLAVGGVLMAVGAVLLVPSLRLPHEQYAARFRWVLASTAVFVAGIVVAAVSISRLG